MQVDDKIKVLQTVRNAIVSNCIPRSSSDNYDTAIMAVTHEINKLVDECLCEVHDIKAKSECFDYASEL